MPASDDAVYCEGCLWRLRPSDAVRALRPSHHETAGSDEVPLAFAHIGHEPPGFRPAGRGTLAALLERRPGRSLVTNGR